MQSTDKPYILFVDDEDMTRKTFERIAGKEFDVLTAESVSAAKTLLDTHAKNIGVLLTDQRMPGQLGVELLEYCRDAYPWIVRMLTTAYSDLADAIAAVNRGEIIRYIEKPWNNIDALLIDLRVAMRFHMLERENTQLLEEKLSVGAAISRLDRVRSLIDIAASQFGFTGRLQSVETMLRALSDLDAVQNPLEAQALQELEMFGQPVSNSMAAIAVASSLGELYGACAPDSASWEELVKDYKNAGVNCDLTSDKNPAGDIQARVAQLILAALSAVGGNAVDKLELSVKNEGTDGWLLEIRHQDGGLCHAADWLSGLTMDEANLAVAGLLLTYLCAGSMGGQVTLNLQANKLSSLLVHIPESQTSVKGDSDLRDNAGWIDDILLLYS